MSQLIYLIIVFITSFILSLIYFMCINFNKVFKFILMFICVLVFSSICYLYNYFIFNEYVLLVILYAIYISYIVKSCVNKKFK